MPPNPLYNDRWWRSADGLRLHYRDYPGAGDPARPPILCLPGLTRNVRDFAALAERLSSPGGGGWRVLCAEMRGRGMSQYAPDPATYTPMHYVADTIALLDQAGIAKVAIIGTSLGGLMVMLMAVSAPERIAGALINDIGPVLESEGLAKIAGHVGADPRFGDWPAAAAHVRALSGGAFPGREAAAWLASARRMMVEDADGTIRFDYDPAIATPFRAANGENSGGAMPDLWPGLLALGARPLLMVRGAISDLLSAATFAEMRRRLPGALAVSVADTGHPPALDEAEVTPALDAWLAQMAKAAG